MDTNSEFKELKETLATLGLSKAWAARQVGVTAAYVGSVLDGRFEPSEALRMEIIDLLAKLKISGLKAV